MTLRHWKFSYFLIFISVQTASAGVTTLCTEHLRVARPLNTLSLLWIETDVPHGDLLLNGRLMLTIIKESPEFRAVLRGFVGASLKEMDDASEYLLRTLERLQAVSHPDVRVRVGGLIAERVNRIRHGYLDRLNRRLSFDIDGEVTEPDTLRAAAADVFRKDGSSPFRRTIQMTANGYVRSGNPAP